MTRFVIDAETALRLVAEDATPGPDHELLAPVLMRSHVLDRLYRQVRVGEIDRDAARDLNARFARLKLRYLGDAVLRRRAWDVAERTDAPGTGLAEYIALVQLQADALVAADPALLGMAEGLVPVQPFEALLA